VTVLEPQLVLKIRRRKFNRQQHHTGEISVTRRLFRSGDSEYLLNGKLCRLRDIQELFMGTGLGPESYALIEQGRIGQILSSRPTDRRAIIEEAAGITKFKTKKRLAEARLEDARTNLNRVNDIFEEVTRQMNSLKRQAGKAERYARLRDEMRAKLRVVLASKFTQMDQESVALETQIHQLGEEIRQQTESVQQSEAEHSERTQRGYAVETETRQNRDRLNQIAIEGDRGKARIRTNEERCAELIVRTGTGVASHCHSRGGRQSFQPAQSAYTVGGAPGRHWPRGAPSARRDRHRRVAIGDLWRTTRPDRPRIRERFTAGHRPGS
jgi:chromosome segregation protein